MRSLNDAMTKKKEEPAMTAAADSLEPEAQIIRAIVTARETHNYTQAQLAEASGIHQANISKLESGSGNPSLRTLKRLAAGMGMRLKLEFVPLPPKQDK